jgi:hypothetical protein
LRPYQRARDFGPFAPERSPDASQSKFKRYVQRLRLASLDSETGLELNRPLKSLDEAYDQFKVKELHSWRLADQRPPPRDTLVRASGSLDAPLAHHLLQPSYTTLSPQDDSETADPTNGCIAMLIGNLYAPRTLVFDHLHRRSEDSEGLKTLPGPVLDCHEDHTRDISESMSAKVELLHGRKVLNRILSPRKPLQTRV